MYQLFHITDLTTHEYTEGLNEAKRSLLSSYGITVLDSSREVHWPSLCSKKTLCFASKEADRNHKIFLDILGLHPAD